MNKYLDEVLDKGEKVLIKNALCSYIREEPSFSSGEFDKACDYAEKRMDQPLYDAHIGNLNNNEKEWDRVYFSNQIAELMENFSKERIDHLKSVSIIVYGKNLEKDKNNEKYRTSINKSKQGEKKEPSKNPILVIIAAVLVIIYILVQIIRGKKAAVAIGLGFLKLMNQFG